MHSPPTHQKPAELKKALRVSDGIALLIGITIGSGIFSTPSIIAGYFPTFQAIMLTWIIVGGFVLIGGLIYAELGTRFPVTGGEYIYLSRAFGPTVGFIFGWAQLFIIRTSPTAGLALIASDYLGFFFEMDQTNKMLVAIGFIALVAAFNYVGVERASTFQKITTLLKVGGLVVFAIGGLILMRGSESQLMEVAPLEGPATGLSAIVAALMLIVFTHTGWDRVGYVAGEMKNPREVIPKSMLVGLSIVLIIYWVTVTVYHYALGVEAMRLTATPAADVAQIMVGPIGASLIAALAIVSAISSINGTTMSASRVYYAMANEKRFFRTFDYVHPTFRTPSRAIIAHAVWAMVILLVRGTFENIAAGMVFAILIFYGLTTIALFKYRWENAGESNAFKMPGYPILPAIYLAGIVLLLIARVTYYPSQSMADLAYVASGIPVAWYWVRKNRPERTD